jgi:hypothetical protein
MGPTREHTTAQLEGRGGSARGRGVYGLYETSYGRSHSGGLQYDNNGIAKFLRRHPAGNPLNSQDIHGCVFESPFPHVFESPFPHVSCLIP